jgi:hypothetical protein
MTSRKQANFEKNDLEFLRQHAISKAA